MKYLLISVLITTCSLIQAQKPVISGRVTDAETGEPLVGVNVFYSPESGVATDEVGFYSISTETGRLRLQYRFIGYQVEFRNIDVAEGDVLTLDVQLSVQTHMLNEVVVSASRFEQRISDVVVSMEVLSSLTVENTHTLSVETALQQVSGVMFLDEQVSIRGGNGYSYGVGSRVMLLQDDLPMLTGSGSEAKWDFVPIETMDQIEVLKGASSAIYGSSALNGVINVRTAQPGPQPETGILFFSGIYDQPKRKEIAWWGNTQPFYTGLRLNHSQAAGNLDIVAGASFFTDDGYRENENEQHARFGLNTRYRCRKVEGLSYGINTNLMFKKGGNFLIWLDGDSGVYRASPVFDQAYNNQRFNLDPHITYHTSRNERHSLKGRYYKVAYDGDTSHNYDDSYFAEYQYLKRFSNNISLTAGSSTTFIKSNSDLFGDVEHTANNYAIYFQAEKPYRAWRFSLGGRYEWHRINTDQMESRPVFRAGLNYQSGKFTFFRASFGQGYRYPSIAEKYAATEVGALKIFPNPALEPEYGWNAEIGFKQGFEIAKLQGYFDAAFFWTQYQNMIEFTFGQHYPPGLTDTTLNDFFKYTGFKAFNITDARITGVELTVFGQGRSGPVDYSFYAGYTYTNPVDLDPAYQQENTASTDENILKYRFYHAFKMRFDVGYRKISTGMNLDYHSPIINIDRAFEDSLRVFGVPLPIFIVPGLREYREAYNTGVVVVNWRVSWDPNEAVKLSFFINNLFNREYMTRPADVAPPRTYAIQLGLRF